MQEKSSGQPGINSLSLYLTLILLGLGIICFDAITKVLALALPATGIWLVRGLGFQLTTNAGVAFGLGQGWLPLVLQLIATLVVLVWLWHLLKTPSSLLLKLAAIMIASGAIANVIDRLTDGQIIDFVALGPWPVFNAADSAITIGVILTLTHSWQQR